MDERQSGRLNSPLRTERGSTMIEDKVVARIANKTAGEVEGVRMGGAAPPEPPGRSSRA